MFFVVFVDDIALFFNSDKLISSVLKLFKARFEIRVTEKIERFLGFSVDSGTG